MVQCVVPTEGSTDNPDQLWKDTPPDQIMDTKLRCQFKMANEAGEGEVEIIKSTASLALTGKQVKFNDEVKGSRPEKDSNQLKNDLVSVQEENVKLNDSISRLKKLAMTESTHHSAGSNAPGARSSPAQQHDSTSVRQKGSGGGVVHVIYYSIYLLVTLAIGILIGKLVL